MNKSQIEKRLDELQTQRDEMSAALDAARVAAPQALIDGKKPVSTVALVEGLEALDAAIAKLTDQREGVIRQQIGRSVPSAAATLFAIRPIKYDRTMTSKRPILRL